MLDLFNKVLQAQYIHTTEDGDYAISVDDTTIYLLFQWSHSHMDWVSNFDFPIKAYKNGNDKWRVHRGFLRVWKAMRDEIEKKVALIMQTVTVKEIICAGYSHGAAIALLATEDMAYLYGVSRVRGYGFGCPRVVWGKVPKAVKDRLQNFHAIRNIPDLVTHLPPVLFGYRHVNLTRIGKTGKYRPIQAHYPKSYQAELAEKKPTTTHEG